MHCPSEKSRDEGAGQMSLIPRLGALFAIGPIQSCPSTLALTLQNGRSRVGGRRFVIDGFPLKISRPQGLACISNPLSVTCSWLVDIQFGTTATPTYTSSVAHTTVKSNMSQRDEKDPHSRDGGDTRPRTFNPPGVPLPPPSYHQVAVTPLRPSTRLITLAGMTGCDPAISSNPSTLIEQAPIAYANIKNSLAAAGATPRDIVQVKHYIVTHTGNPAIDKFEVVDRGWAPLWCEFMDTEADGHRPPDTVIGVASLAKKDILYECEVWAVVST